MKFYTYYRSQAAFRVRIAMNLKGIAHDDTYLHLEKGDQFDPAYKAVNPQMVVPTLIDGDAKLFQSLAILEYLEETYPNPPLLPQDAASRAWCRGFALINIADSHPLIVPRIRHYLLDEMNWSQAQLGAWIERWIGAGLQAMETLLTEHNEAGKFCHGDRPTFADIGLVTQVTPARTFNADPSFAMAIDLAGYPRVMRVYETCMAIPAFADAAPARQPDAE
jgi:maleylacetoacetate isomerase